jgi:hypothetical protein
MDDVAGGSQRARLEVASVRVGYQNLVIPRDLSATA